MKAFQEWWLIGSAVDAVLTDDSSFGYSAFSRACRIPITVRQRELHCNRRVLMSSLCVFDILVGEDINVVKSFADDFPIDVFCVGSEDLLAKISWSVHLSQRVSLSRVESGVLAS